ncbi:MAG: hypothetical protein ACQETI_03770 [Halobacteriota archaeon]
MPSSRQTPRESETAIGRRQLIAALGSASAIGLAGCQELQSQSFEAEPTALSEESQKSLRMGEIARDSQTIERTALGGSVDVSITSHAAIYSRAVGLGGR